MDQTTWLRIGSRDGGTDEVNTRITYSWPPDFSLRPTGSDLFGETSGPTSLGGINTHERPSVTVLNVSICETTRLRVYRWVYDEESWETEPRKREVQVLVSRYGKRWRSSSVDKIGIRRSVIQFLINMTIVKGVDRKSQWTFRPDITLSSWLLPW